MNFKHLDKVLLSAFHYWRACGYPWRSYLGREVHVRKLELDCCLFCTDMELPMINRHARDDWGGSGYSPKPYNDHIFTRIPSDEQMEAAFGIFYEPRTKAMLEEIFGFSYIVSVLRLFRSVPNVGSGVGPQSWHRDGTPPFSARGILYLNDVDERGGPFEYQDQDAGVPVSVFGEKGTLVLFDANRVVHRARAPVDRERFVIDLCFTPQLHHGEKVVAPGLCAWPRNPFKFSTDGMKVYPA